MKRIALDLDGVLIDTMGSFVRIWNEIRIDTKTINDITRALKHYVNSDMVDYYFIDSSRDDNDMRQTYLIDLENGIRNKRRG